jgi:carboxypeptidase Taq
MDTNHRQNYQELQEISLKTKLFMGISSILSWDQETMMPVGAAPIRAQQLKAMAGLIHEHRTSKEFRKVLERLIDIDTGKILATDLTVPEKAALVRWRRDYLHERALPQKFVEEFAALTSQSQVIWRKAKEKNAFQDFAPYLTKIVQMIKKKADYLGYEDHPYDALLDQYEPGVKAKKVSELFHEVKKPIVELLKKIQSKKQVEDSFLFGRFPTSKQIAYGRKILDAVGYTSEFGRVDFSSHPFSSSSHPRDSRITTRIHPTGVMSNISVLLHEAGHSLYEMGLPEEHYGSPLCEAVSLGIHESQSRFWETRIGQSKSFWSHFYPLLQKTFKTQLNTVSLESFYKAINKVEASFIRVEADEVTYPLHVIMRFDLEMELIEDKIRIEDISEAWKDKVETFLGIRPDNDREGCLQDVHWSLGAFGYFPTYLLGNLYAAPLFLAFSKDYPDWEKKFAKGELLFVRDWLSKKIYRFGRQYDSVELIENATEMTFSAKPYLDYLHDKYAEIYG